MVSLSALVVNELTFLSLWVALFAGLVSFLSPCVFPLVPAYIAQLTGSGMTANEIAADRKLIFSRSIGFILGFTSIFLIIGAASSFVGTLFLGNQQLLQQLGGIIIVMFGLQLIGVFNFSFLMGEKKFSAPKKSASFGRSVAFGLIFAAGWSPCIGLVLGSILALGVGQGADPSGMMVLLLFYSVGIGLPFLIVSMLYAKSLDKVRNINRYLPIIQKSSGAIMILLGVLLFTGIFARMAAYLSQYIPFGI